MYQCSVIVWISRVQKCMRSKSVPMKWNYKVNGEENFINIPYVQHMQWLLGHATCIHATSWTKSIVLILDMPRYSVDHDSLLNGGGCVGIHYCLQIKYKSTEIESCYDANLVVTGGTTSCIKGCNDENLFSSLQPARQPVITMLV